MSDFSWTKRRIVEKYVPNEVIVSQDPGNLPLNGESLSKLDHNWMKLIVAGSYLPTTLYTDMRATLGLSEDT